MCFCEDVAGLLPATPFHRNTAYAHCLGVWGLGFRVFRSSAGFRVLAKVGFSGTFS